MQHEDIVQGLRKYIAAAGIEPHRVDVVAQQGQRLFSGESMRQHPILQRLGNGDR